MSSLDLDVAFDNIDFPIESISGVWKFSRPPHFRFLCYSLPGHLLHLVTRGSYTLIIGNREYRVNEGDIIYYYETEEVESIGDDREYCFYSVGFRSSKLMPFSMENRVLRANERVKQHFSDLYSAYSDKDYTGSYRLFALLLSILDEMGSLHSKPPEMQREGLWWDLEYRLRKQKNFRPSLYDLSKIAGYSKSTIIRSCKKSTGTSPMKRMQLIRMEEAKGLLSFKQYKISQIADYLGYSRIQEFSREFSGFCGCSPRTFIAKSEY